MNPLLVVRATIARHRGTYLLFTLLVAVATAIGVAITTQEAALRIGSARAADKFDLVVAAPGSETDVALAAIYLRPGTVPLLDPAIVGKVLAEPRATISAPLGFGDNVRGAEIVGTVPAFVDYLSGGLSEGRVFAPRMRPWPAPPRPWQSRRSSVPTTAGTRFWRPNVFSTPRRSPWSVG